MRLVLLPIALFLPIAAHADDSRIESRQIQCSAHGFNAEYELDSVLGAPKPTREEAEDSAVKACSELFKQCTVEWCY